jgi:hypothetical protein
MRREIDAMIGRVDRALSEILVAAGRAGELDAPDVQTLAHHADDLVGVGQKVRSLLVKIGATRKKERSSR